MKYFNRFHIVRFFCLATLFLGIAGSSALQAEDMWVLPMDNGWIGEGMVGSAIDPGLVPIRYLGNIILVPVGAVSGYLQKGGKVGWPDVVVPLIVDGKLVAVPIWQVADLLRKGAQAADDLFVMHKGDELIAVRKVEVNEYTAKGYELGPKQDWREGVVMCAKGHTVIVARAAVEKYKKEGAELGPCKKK